LRRRLRRYLLHVNVFLMWLFAVLVSLPTTPDLTSLGAAIPGFFADQSTEVIEYMMKTIYFTAMWTAHVHP
jgi:hypothetical protein